MRWWFDPLPLDRIERKLNYLINLVGATSAKQEHIAMATQQEIDALNAAVAENTSETGSAVAALNAYLTKVEDLTTQLQNAISNGDSAAVNAAAAALAVNNAQLKGAVPSTVEAIFANTYTHSDAHEKLAATKKKQ
jgi:uncharacterized coiled-coil protein SlyX